MAQGQKLSFWSAILYSEAQETIWKGRFVYERIFDPSLPRRSPTLWERALSEQAASNAYERIKMRERGPLKCEWLEGLRIQRSFSSPPLPAQIQANLRCGSQARCRSLPERLCQGAWFHYCSNDWFESFAFPLCGQACFCWCPALLISCPVWFWYSHSCIPSYGRLSWEKK